MTSFLAVLATLGVAVLLAPFVTFLVLWWKQERILFQPPRVHVLAPDSSVTRLAYHASDAQALRAYLVGLPQPATALVLAFHGNADVAEWLVPWARELHARTGASVLLPEYRGYSGLPGRPTYTASQADARAALRYVEDELRVARRRLVLFGHSLGSAVAPVFAAHGARDLLVPMSMARAVHESARVRGDLLVVSSAGHNDVPEKGQQAYWTWISRAVARAAAAE